MLEVIQTQLFNCNFSNLLLPIIYVYIYIYIYIYMSILARSSKFVCHKEPFTDNELLKVGALLLSLIGSMIITFFS